MPRFAKVLGGLFCAGIFIIQLAGCLAFAPRWPRAGVLDSRTLRLVGIPTDSETSRGDFAGQLPVGDLILPCTQKDTTFSVLSPGGEKWCLRTYDREARRTMERIIPAPCQWERSNAYAFRRDGGAIAYLSASCDLHIRNSDGSDDKILAQGLTDSYITGIRWLRYRDTGQIEGVICRSKDGSDAGFVFSISSATSEIRTLYKLRDLADADLSPNGKWIVAVEDALAAERLHLVDTSTGNDVVILEIKDGIFYDRFSWSSDERTLVFACDLGIYKYDLATQELMLVRKLHMAEDDLIYGLGFLDDSFIYCYIDRDSGKGKLFVLWIENGKVLVESSGRYSGVYAYDNGKHIAVAAF